MQYPRDPERIKRGTDKKTLMREKPHSVSLWVLCLGWSLGLPAPKDHVQDEDPFYLHTAFGKEHEPFLLLQKVRRERNGEECF